MIAEYAGMEIDVGHTLWLFDTWRTTPIFHRVKFAGERGARYLVTRCGTPVNSDERGGLASATVLPAKHGVKIGRPCLTCWPELRRQTSIFATRRPGPRETLEQLETAS